MSVTLKLPAADAVPVGLHSPPESNSAQKDGGSDSELSDLEADHTSHDLLNVEPDHISEGNVPVFRPTMEEFKDFQKYVSTLGSYRQTIITRPKSNNPYSLKLLINGA